MERRLKKLPALVLCGGVGVWWWVPGGVCIVHQIKLIKYLFFQNAYHK